MVIECSSCHARFKLADDKVKERGTKVRCTKCREVFTVFPESSPPITPSVVAVAPVVPVNPVVVIDKDVVDEEFFSFPDESSIAAEIPVAAADFPVSEEEDWNQQTESALFADEYSDETGVSDLDAINFDNLETPVFSVSRGKDSKFEFIDDTAFTFKDSPLEGGQEEQYKIAKVSVDKTLTTTSTSEDLSQKNADATADEFTFSPAENAADFSWDEPDAITPKDTVAAEKSQTTRTASEDTAFDFSSFSFDDVPASVGSDEMKNAETFALSETTIELSRETETSPAPLLTRPPSPEVAKLPPTPPVIIDRHESTPPAEKTLRPRPRSRSRQKKKGSPRLAVKALFAIFLVLTLIYGIMNREQIQKDYKNIVNGFIENQVPVETSGRIGLVKLSGDYVLNSQEGDLFVIRGEVVNEFKGLRSSVLVRGAIYGENGVILQSQSAYCGNPLKDNSLKKLEFKEIRNVMNNELGENLVNLNITPGKNVPCTIVFNKVPKNIKEFTVEVLESKPGSK